MCSRTIGIATQSPSTVVTSACEIPPAISFGSPVPKSVIAWKVLIMPVTVPSSPISGATTEMILRNSRPRFSAGVSLKIASESFSSSVSVSADLFSSCTLSTRPSALSLLAVSLFSCAVTLRLANPSTNMRSRAMSSPIRPIEMIR